MKVLRLDHHESSEWPTVVCLGFFDGIHLGHMRLIEQAREVREKTGLKVCVHTFDTIPARVLKPQVEVLELTPPNKKKRVLASVGVDILAVSTFTSGVSHMRAAAFFSEILLNKLSARHIVAGFHHRFGYRGEGDTQTLRHLCQENGIGLDIIEPVRLPDGELISSTAIRTAILEGDIARAERMLGRPWLDTS